MVILGGSMRCFKSITCSRWGLGGRKSHTVGNRTPGIPGIPEITGTQESRVLGVPNSLSHREHLMIRLPRSHDSRNTRLRQVHLMARIPYTRSSLANGILHPPDHPTILDLTKAALPYLSVTMAPPTVNGPVSNILDASRHKCSAAAP